MGRSPSHTPAKEGYALSGLSCRTGAFTSLGLRLGYQGNPLDTPFWAGGANQRLGYARYSSAELDQRR